MTPPTIIIMIGMWLILHLIVKYMGWDKIKKTTEFDSPKDDLYYLERAKLNQTTSTELEAGHNSLELVEVIEETNTYIWDSVKKHEKLHTSCTNKKPINIKTPIIIEL